MSEALFSISFDAFHRRMRRPEPRQADLTILHPQESAVLPHIVILGEDSSFALYLQNLLGRHGHAAISLIPGKGTFRRLGEQNRRAPVRLLIADIFMPGP